MSSAAVLDSVWRLLANDPTFLAFKSLTPASAVADKAAYIVNEEETEDIVTADTIPVCLLYTRPGKPDARTSRVYIGKVVIDCFAHDGNTARQMVDQTVALMQNWQPDAPGAFVTIAAYETSFKTGITGVKGHRIFYDISRYVG